MITQGHLVIDPEVLRRHSYAGPRYTSYPTADRFVEAFDAGVYTRWLGKRGLGGMGRPLSMYVHVPFCDTVCFYCACNKVVTRDHGRASTYLRYLAREAELVSESLDGDRRLAQLHWGGGTPNYLNSEEAGRLWALITRHFDLEPDLEASIELNPARCQLRRRVASIT